MKRRNVDVGKLRRPLIRRGRIGEDIYGSVFTYVKFFSVWVVVLMADFILNFRFEYLWPLWLLVRSVYDSMKYQGLAFSIFFVCVTITSDVVCYLLIPVQWLFFTASTYVWVQYVWQTERGICLPTVLLWLMFLYIEVAVRLRELRSFPFHLDLCRPFAAHCVGYPVVTMSFSFKSCISYRFRLRKQKEIEKANNFYFQLLQQALPSDMIPNNAKLKVLPAQTQDELALNGSSVGSSVPVSRRSRALSWLDINIWSGIRDKQPSSSDVLDDTEFMEHSIEHVDDTSSEEGGMVPAGDECRANGSVKGGTTLRASTGIREVPLGSSSAAAGKRSKMPNIGTNLCVGKDVSLTVARLEADVKRLKAELQSSRCTEQELRSQISSLSITDRTTKNELYQLRQDNDNLQSKLQKVVASRQQDKQSLAALERRIQEERKQKASLESQLAMEKQRRKNDDLSRAIVPSAAALSRTTECTSDQCRLRRTELENDVKAMCRELKMRDDELRQLELETQTLQQYRGDSQTETEVLITTLGAMKDKNAHLETSLSAETRLKLDLFSALGDAKRQIEIQQSMLMQKEMELAALRSKVAEVMSFMPAVTLASFTRGSGSTLRYSPTYVTGMQPDGSVSLDYTTNISQ
jgi:hypothetical protein